MSRAYLALGSNLGNRQACLDRAVERLRAEPGIVVRKVSPCYETIPVGGPPGQGNYLNAAVAVETSLDPLQLLQVLFEIERSAGRVRDVANSPRTLDLDIVLYENLIRASPDPIVPHPRMHERRFVLQPLADIAPDAVHPVLGRTIAQLLASLPEEADPPVRTQPVLSHGRELAGMTALVTGSTSGIGRAIALEFARAGAAVIVHGRSASTIDATVSEIRAIGATASALQADLRDAAARRRLLDDARSATGGIDIWVNNAGADLLTGEAADWTFERKWQELIDVDVTATIELSRRAGERMLAGAGGVILNMGWDQAETGMAGDSGQLFGAAKAAVMAFTKSLAVTLAPRVRVNCLAPGWIKTAWGETASEEWQQRVHKETPLARWGLPEDVARTARWLVSPAAAFVTGQIIRINGGAVR